MSVFIVEGHNVAVQNIGETIKLWHLQILWSELNHITVRLHDFNTEREQLTVRLCLCKSKRQIDIKSTYLDSKTKTDKVKPKYNISILSGFWYNDLYCNNIKVYDNMQNIPVQTKFNSIFF